MSFTKAWLEELSVLMGHGGEINDTVMARGDEILSSGRWGGSLSVDTTRQIHVSRQPGEEASRIATIIATVCETTLDGDPMWDVGGLLLAASCEDGTEIRILEPTHSEYKLYSGTIRAT